MMKYLDKSFSVPIGDTKAYRDNWEQIFGKKDKNPAEKPASDEEPVTEDEPKQK